MTKERIAKIGLNAFLLIGVCVSLFPFYWMIVMATQSTSDVLTYPPKLIPGGMLTTYLKEIFENTNFVHSFMNTTMLSLVNVVVVLFFDSLAGFAFAKYKFPARNKLFAILLLTMMIPGQLTIVPSYNIMDKLGWINSYKALIIPGMANAFGIFWIKQYAEDAIPDSLLESAYMDGASSLRSFFSIAVPILRPPMSFLGVFTFMNTWNDYLWPLIIINDDKKFTLMLELANLKGLYSIDYSLVIAGTLLATIPLLIVFFLGSKNIISGLTAGAVKD